MNFNKWLIVIPARLASQRLANKPLQSVAGKALIVRVYENIKILKSKGAEVTVATDSEEILSLCQSEAIACQMTSHKHKSGTDRCLEVALKSKHPFIMNVQGDEPFLKVVDLIKLMETLESSSHDSIATLAYKSNDMEDLHDSNIVKVTMDKFGNALYFSRSPIPAFANTEKKPRYFHKHIGVYAYTCNSLKYFCTTCNG